MIRESRDLPRGYYSRGSDIAIRRIINRGALRGRDNTCPVNSKYEFVMRWVRRPEFSKARGVK